MRLGQLETVFAMVWILATAIAGFLADLTSPLSWMGVAGRPLTGPERTSSAQR